MIIAQKYSACYDCHICALIEHTVSVWMSLAQRHCCCIVVCLFVFRFNFSTHTVIVYMTGAWRFPEVNVYFVVSCWPVKATCCYWNSSCFFSIKIIYAERIKWQIFCKPFRCKGVLDWALKKMTYAHKFIGFKWE